MGYSVFRRLRFSPRARGSPHLAVHHRMRGCPFPASAGIIPPRPTLRSRSSASPRAHGDQPSCWRTPRAAGSSPRERGDRPSTQPTRWPGHSCSPHARRSTLAAIMWPKLRESLPASAGINPTWTPASTSITASPRVRGDQPTEAMTILFLLCFSPRARGSTPHFAQASTDDDLLPACTGINPSAHGDDAFFHVSPRAYGDRPP